MGGSRSSGSPEPRQRPKFCSTGELVILVIGLRLFWSPNKSVLPIPWTLSSSCLGKHFYIEKISRGVPPKGTNIKIESVKGKWDSNPGPLDRVLKAAAGPYESYSSGPQWWQSSVAYWFLVGPFSFEELTSINF